MTKKQFHTYRFSANTQVKIDGDWYYVKSVTFHLEILEVGDEWLEVSYGEITDIREKVSE
jgi:hypothetical protein